MTISEKELNSWLENNPSLLKRNPSLTKSAALPDKKRAKYGNTKVYVYSNGYISESHPADGNGKPAAVFDSRKEFNRWEELKRDCAIGLISDLRRQVPMLIQPEFEYNGSKIPAVVYKADFVYIRSGKTVVEDVKGYSKKSEKYISTKEFRLKWKLLMHKYPQYSFELY